MKSKIDLSQIPYLQFAETLKKMKAKLPKACSFLGPLMTSKGELQIRAIVNKVEYRFVPPKNVSFEESDVLKLRKLILEKC